MIFSDLRGMRKASRHQPSRSAGLLILGLVDATPGGDRNLTIRGFGPASTAGLVRAEPLRAEEPTAAMWNAPVWG